MTDPAKPHWHPHLPTLQLRWSATALGTAMACWRRYFYHYILRLRDPERSADLDWGDFLHRALAVFDETIHAGGTPDEATVAALRKAMELTEHATIEHICPECDTIFEPGRTECPRCNFPVSAETAREAQRLGLWQSDNNAKTRATLLRAIANYADDLPVLEPLVLPGAPVAEVKFELDPTPDGFTVYGRLDGLVSGYGPNSAWIRERKSTKSTLSRYYFQTFAPHVEVSVQSLAAREGWAGAAGVRVYGVMVEAIQAAVGFVRYGREMVNVPEERTIEFRRTLTKVWEDARRWAERTPSDLLSPAAADPWPMNESACYNCHFRGLCAKAPSVRSRFYEEFRKEEPVG